MNAIIAKIPNTAQPASYEDPSLYGNLDAEPETNPFADEADAAEEDNLILKLSHPYTFMGKEYTELDLHGLESLKASDLMRTSKLYTKLHPAANPATMETNMEYAFFIASRVLGQPFDFFEGLPARDAISLKTSVVGFFFSGDGED